MNSLGTRLAGMEGTERWGVHDCRLSGLLACSCTQLQLFRVVPLSLKLQVCKQSIWSAAVCSRLSLALVAAAAFALHFSASRSP